MINVSDARMTLDMGDHYVIQPQFDWWSNQHLQGTPLEEGFAYASDTNSRWLSIDELSTMVADV
jgi:UDP-N-acetylglucosamine 4,6-dehydratase